MIPITVLSINSKISDFFIVAIHSNALYPFWQFRVEGYKIQLPKYFGNTPDYTGPGVSVGCGNSVGVGSGVGLGLGDASGALHKKSSLCLACSA